jgi:hypothetical protein
VGAVGIETGPDGTSQPDLAAVVHGEGEVNVSERVAKCASVRVPDDSRRNESAVHEGGGQGPAAEDGGVPASEFAGVVETALARALTLAAEAQRWEVVAQLATELRARRESRVEAEARVVQLHPSGERDVPTATRVR